MPIPVIERALSLLPHVDFVNAYGLTETSSTIAVLGPEDHRAARRTRRPRRCGVGSARSAGPCPTSRSRSVAGTATPREGQGAGRDLGAAASRWPANTWADPDATEDGWFPTRDSGFLDEDGYLFLSGRLDDVIVRGGENMSPGEIEDVLVAHPGVADAAVFGVPHTEWGEMVVAAVVVADGATASEAELQDWVRNRLRSAKTPERIVFRDDLPYNDLGKLLRRVLKQELTEVASPPTA